MQKQVPGLLENSSFSSSLHIKQITSKPFYFLTGKKQGGGGCKGTRRGTLQTLLARLQLGHFLHIDPDALTVKQHKVDGLDGGRHGGHKVAGDGLKDQLGRRLLRKAVPDRKVHTHFNEVSLKLLFIYLKFITLMINEMKRKEKPC